MRVILFFLLSVCLVQPALAATTPAVPSSSSVVTPADTHVLPAPNKKAKKVGFFAKLKQKMVQYCISRGMLLDGEPTAKQKKLGTWALVLGIGSILLLLIPQVSLIAIPAAIAGLILGIKSVKGNSNAQGIIGIIASGLTLLLLLLAIALAVAFLASWN